MEMPNLLKPMTKRENPEANSVRVDLTVLSRSSKKMVATSAVVQE